MSRSSTNVSGWLQYQAMALIIRGLAAFGIAGVSVALWCTQKVGYRRASAQEQEH